MSDRIKKVPWTQAVDGVVGVSSAVGSTLNSAANVGDSFTSVDVNHSVGVDERTAVSVRMIAGAVVAIVVSIGVVFVAKLMTEKRKGGRK